MGNEMTPAIDTFTLVGEADRLFYDHIYERWKKANNVWRNAWAMDTLLDYFAVGHADPAALTILPLRALDPNLKGNWWDDFGWIGIAALRAAEQINDFHQHPDYRDRYLKIAINAWAYMYGPGWSKSSKAIYPFTDEELPGWDGFATSHESNIGAPNVWNQIAQTWEGISEDEKMKQKPRYSPGGVWNSPITNFSHPELVPAYQQRVDYFDTYVSPIQNTVTNLVYAILTLRIFQASSKEPFSKVFSESTLDADACLQAWKNQIVWLDQWMVQTKGDESLQRSFDKTSSLVRERVSTFNEYGGTRYWDASYCKDWVWTGDQGLLLGVLREGKAAGYLKSKVLDLYPNIVEGVFNYGYQPRTYDKTITGSFLLPWIVLESKDPSKEGALFNDVGDYQTGTGVFMRYLLQAYKAEPALVQKHKDTIMTCASNIIKKGFGTDPNPEDVCDAFTPSGDSVDQMTAYVNRLSVLLLAIEMNAKR
jgi:hypothetical protein